MTASPAAAFFGAVAETQNHAAAPARRDRRGRWVGSGVRITGLGHYYPRRQVRNPPAAEMPAGNRVDKAVVGDVGVLTRHLSDDSETVVAMGVAAARDALADAGRTPADVDLLILVNWTARSLVPELAPQLAGGLGAEYALAFDLCGACTGFMPSDWSIGNVGGFSYGPLISFAGPTLKSPVKVSGLPSPSAAM